MVEAGILLLLNVAPIIIIYDLLTFHKFKLSNEMIEEIKICKIVMDRIGSYLSNSRKNPNGISAKFTTSHSMHFHFPLKF